MTETRSPAEVAGAIAEDMRALAYLTGAGGSVELEYPSDLYDVVGGLKEAASRFPQVLGQMARWLAAEQAAGRVAHDSGGASGEYVEAVVDAFGRASTDAETLAEALETAHSAGSGLTGGQRA